MADLKPCPFCGDSWIYSSAGDYASGYELQGYRVNCHCGYAWEAIGWQSTEDEAIAAWNTRAEVKSDV